MGDLSQPADLNADWQIDMSTYNMPSRGHPLLKETGALLRRSQPTARPRIQALSASLIREVANAAMSRKDILPFWFGESDQPTPAFIREAATASLQKGETFYTENLGRAYLREQVSAYLTDLHQTRIGADRIAMTSSGDSALMLAGQLILEPGDHVVLITPLWPNLVEMPKILSAEVTCVPLEVRQGRWTLPLEKVLAAIGPNTRMLYVNSPNNPTGWTISRDEQRILFEHCRRHGIWILADDVYERLIYRDGLRAAPSFLTLAEEDDRVIGVNSFSKAWRMTGWRVGWMVVPPSIVPNLACLIEYNTSCIPEFVQRAATAALQYGEPHVARLRSELIAARQYLIDGLRALPGIEVPESDGAMYVFLRIAGYADSLQLAKLLVEEAGLGLAPGRAFGPEGEGWLRWCYATDLKKLHLGLERLAAFLAK
jgi:aspartate/methionine/tyrosine aminotransferase